MSAVARAVDGGIVVTHLVNWLSPLKERVTTVTGERGCFVADTLTADLTFYQNGTEQAQWDRVAAFRGVAEGDMIRYAIPKPEPLHDRAVATSSPRSAASRPSLVTLEEGLATVRVAEALRESADRPGETVEVGRMKITVVGLGKIGLPLAVQFAGRGHHVVGADIDRRRRRRRARGRARRSPARRDLAERLRGRGRPRARSRRRRTPPRRSPASDAVVVVVPLYVDACGSPDFSAIDAATDGGRRAACAPARSSPTRRRCRSAPRGTGSRRRSARRSGLRAGRGLLPRVQPRAGVVRAGLRRPRALPEAGRRRRRSRARGGPPSSTRAGAASSTSAPTCPEPNGVWDLGSAEAAELAKLAETTYRDVNIGLANQFALYADRIGVDFAPGDRRRATRSRSATSTSPGIAVGGHCIPVYPWLYLGGDPDGDHRAGGARGEPRDARALRRPARRGVRRPDRGRGRRARRLLPRRGQGDRVLRGVRDGRRAAPARCGAAGARPAVQPGRARRPRARPVPARAARWTPPWCRPTTPSTPGCRRPTSPACASCWTAATCSTPSAGRGSRSSSLGRGGASPLVGADVDAGTPRSRGALDVRRGGAFRRPGVDAGAGRLQPVVPGAVGPEVHEQRVRADRPGLGPGLQIEALLGRCPETMLCR